jgi:2-isopropylmalate synthase
MDKTNQIDIFATTLRDGQQCPGAAISFKKDLQYARLAAKAGIDVLEAGIPSASKLDFDIVHTIATEIANSPDAPVIAALCQQRQAQVERAMEALMRTLRYQTGRVHISLPVAPDLMEASLGERASKKRALIRETQALYAFESRAGFEVEFSPEGYSRIGENFDCTTDIIRAAIEGSAKLTRSWRSGKPSD